jgi:hypothetical protein
MLCGTPWRNKKIDLEDIPEICYAVHNYKIINLKLR